MGPSSESWYLTCLYFSFHSYLSHTSLSGVASQNGTIVNNSPASVGDARDAGWIPGWGRSPGVGNGNPIQYFCLVNPVNRGAW